MMRISLFVALLAGSFAVAAIEPLRPGDFALGMPIAHDPELPYFEVELPELAYRTVTDARWRDVRFFDADGHALRHFEASTAGQLAEPYGSRIELPIFPIAGAQSRGASRDQITIAANGSLVTIATQQPLPGSEIVAYVIDASGLKGEVDHFRVEAGSGAFGVAAYAIDGGVDLHSWTNLVPRAELVRLEHDGHVLEQLQFRTNRLGFRYLRLRWLEPRQAPQLARVEASLRHAGESAALNTFSIDGKAESGEPHIVVFDSGGHFRIRKLAVVVQANRFLPGSLEASNDRDGPWQHVHRGDWYALRVDDLTLRSSAIDVRPESFRYWRFVASDAEQLSSGPLPALEISWSAHTFRVLAEGRAPYLLALGSGRAATHSAQALPLSARELGAAADMSAPATLGKSFALGGRQRLLEPKAPLPWQRIVLWLVLCAGVGAIALLAWRLYREIRNAEAT